MSSTFEVVGSVTLTSNGAIDITGISGAYTDLLVKGNLRAAGGSTVENCTFFFNNDTSAVYSDMRMIGYGNSPGTFVQNSDWNLTSAVLGAIQGPSAVVSGGFTPFELKIAQYANTSRWKFYIGAWSTYTYEAGYRNGNYRSLNAINRMTFSCGGGANFAAGSSVTIWGIKAK